MPTSDATATLTPEPSLPPGPSLLATLEFLRDPFHFLDRCAQRFGEWFTVRVPGVAPFVFTSEPAAVRDVFLADNDILHAGEANRPLGAFMGERSSLFLDGAAHLHQRRLLLPAFHGERMRSYTEVMSAAVNRAIDQFPVNQSFAIHEWMRTVTFDVIMRAVFGMDDGEPARSLRDKVQRLFALFTGRAGTLFGLPAMRIDLGPWSPWGRALRMQREVDALLYAEFARRRREGLAGREDILSILLGARDEHDEPMGDEVLRDEMMTLMLAGHETTAASLAWTIHNLLTHPQVMKEARAEVASVLNSRRLTSEDMGSLKYVEAVINETLRLNPVIPNFARVLKAPMRIGSQRLPAGVAIAPCIYLVHRRAELWPEPERFNPERFRDARPPANSFIPFGGGTRRCLGAAFASYQMKVVIAQLLLRVELKSVGGYRARALRRSIAFAPSEGLPVIAARIEKPSSTMPTTVGPT